MCNFYKESEHLGDGKYKLKKLDEYIEDMEEFWFIWYNNKTNYNFCDNQISYLIPPIFFSSLGNTSTPFSSIP